MAWPKGKPRTGQNVGRKKGYKYPRAILIPGVKVLESFPLQDLCLLIQRCEAVIKARRTPHRTSYDALQRIFSEVSALALNHTLLTPCGAFYAGQTLTAEVLETLTYRDLYWLNIGEPGIELAIKSLIDPLKVKGTIPDYLPYKELMANKGNNPGASKLR